MPDSKKSDRTHHPRDTDLISDVTDDDQREAQFGDLLAVYDEALRRGLANTNVSTAKSPVPPDLAEELEQAKECVQLLEQVWPRSDSARMTTHPSLAEETESLVGVDRVIGQSIQDKGPAAIRQFGRFKIVREIGRGGSGIVYSAIDPKLDRKVALKLPRPEFLFSSDLRCRFLQEAQVAAGLSHPNIVSVHEVGEAGPICFIASALCAGPTLAAWMKERKEPVPIRVTAHLLAELADAVQHAHSRGILHRDLKPSNVLLEPRETSEIAPKQNDESWFAFVPKLTDFGLAKLTERSSDLTSTGAVIGTPAYMAPEQAEGRNDEIGPPTDVYALGVILYEMLSGQAPFRGTSDLKTLHQVVHDEPRPLHQFTAGVPRELEAICLKCLEKEPGRRYLRAGDLAKDLRCFLAGLPTVARPTGIGKRMLKWAQRQPTFVALILVGCLSLVAICGGALWHGFSLRQSQQKTAQALTSITRLEGDADRRHREMIRHEYVDHVHDAYEAWRNGRVASALEMLERCQPGFGDEDQRGFEWYFVRRLCEGGLRTLRGHQGHPVHGASFSPTGDRLATCGGDGAIQIWNPNTGDLLAKFSAQSGPVNSVAFSPNGKLLATAGDDGHMKLWDADTHELVRVLEGPAARLLCLVFSPDGETIVAAGEGPAIIEWDVASGERRSTISVESDTVYALAMSPDGKKLAGACSDQTAKVWNLTSPSDQVYVADPRKDVYSVAFSPDNQTLATGGDLVHLWDLDSGTETFLPGNRNIILSIAFSPDGRRLATAGNDETIQIWNVAHRTIQYSYNGHARPILDLAFSSCGELLASADKGGTMKIWDAESPPGRRSLSLGSNLEEMRVAFSPTDDILAISSYRKGGQGSVSLWRISSVRQELILRLTNETIDAGPNSLTFSPDGRYLAAAYHDGDLVRCWHVKEPKKVVDFALPNAFVAFSPDGRRIAVTSATGQDLVRILGLDSGFVTWTLPGQNGVAFSPDNRLIAIESVNSMFGVELWDLIENRSVAVMPGHTGPVYSMAFSEDGRVLATSSVDGTARLWDAEQHLELHTLRGHVDGVFQVIFGPHRRTVVTAGNDGTVRFWDVKTGRPILVLPVTTKRVESISFSSDGQVLATGYRHAELNGRVDLWYAPRGHE